MWNCVTRNCVDRGVPAFVFDLTLFVNGDIHSFVRRNVNKYTHSNNDDVVVLLAFTTHLRVLASSLLRFRDHTQ
jgi:hypothetical protein